MADCLVNKLCCAILNRLLATLNCFSAPISDLHQLSDGVALVELIECFEDITLLKSDSPDREPLHREAAASNTDYIEQWLHAEGILLATKRSIRDIFGEIERSNREIGLFVNSDASMGNIVKQQQMLIYSRSIAYISALCYAIFSIFLKHESHFRRIVPKYNFAVADDEMLHLQFYTKWKLTEEELLLKELELMKQKDINELLEIELHSLRSNGSTPNDNQTLPLKVDSFQKAPSLESLSSSVTISSLSEVETASVGTITSVFGHLDKPLIFDRSLSNSSTKPTMPTIEEEEDNNSEKFDFKHTRAQVENALCGHKQSKLSHKGYDEEKQNRILIARLLAELSYQTNKNKLLEQKQIRQTNVEYI